MKEQQAARRVLIAESLSRRRNRAVAILATMVVMCGLALTSEPVYAATETSSATASSLIEKAEIAVGVDDDAHPSPVEVVSEGDVETVKAASGGASVEVTVGVGEEQDTVYTADKLSANATRFAAVLTAESDDQASWEFGDDVQLQILADGRVVVSDLDGNLIAGIDSPWAVDGSGKLLSTHYSIEGHVLTQHVDYGANVVFPVVADPTVAVYPGYYQINLNRSESITATSSIAACAALFSKSPVPALKAAVIGCGVFAAYGTPQLANGKCLRINVAGIPPVLTTWWPTWPKC